MHQPTYPAPPRRRTSPLAIVALIVGVVLVLLLVAVFVLMAAGGSDGTTPVGGKAPGAAESTRPAGSTAADQHFTFRVTSTATTQRVKSDGGTATAKGRFIRVRIAVTNHAAKPRYIFADDQQLHASGKTYDVDVDATVDVDKGPEIGLPEKINPDATETIELVYDVPETAKPTALEVHGSSGSAGALIALPGN